MCVFRIHDRCCPLFLQFHPGLDPVLVLWVHTGVRRPGSASIFMSICNYIHVKFL